MADKTYTLEIIAKGLKEVTKGIEQLNKETAQMQSSQTSATKGNKAHAKSQSQVVEQNKGVAFATNNSTHAFSKMSKQMQGTLVPAYATVAANVFALTAAFGALERAADFSILVDSAESLASQTGRSLVTLSKQMKEVTGDAISMKEALVSASIAASAGFDNETILKLTQVARNASVALGREMTDALNRVFKGAIKAEPELLDELGIILRLDTAARKYAATLGKTAQELSTFEKQQAVVNDVIAQGEKKFGKLAEIDPNPYTQLAAAFHDIATALVNFIGLPIGSVLSILSENVTALAAVMLLFATRVAKFAFPALNNFSKVIDERVTNSIENLGKRLETINAQKLTIFDKSQEKRIKSADTAIDNLIDKSIVGFREMGKTGGAGFTKLSEGITDTEKRLKTFRSTYNAALTRMKNGLPSLGLAPTAENITLVEAGLAKTNVALEELRGTASRGIFLKVVEGATKARLSLATFTSQVTTATLATFKFVNESTTGFGGLWAAIQSTTAATTGLTRAFALLGTVAAGALALIFKFAAPLLTLVIAWELLSSAVSAVYGFFANPPEVDLANTLSSMEGQLDDVSSATINYRENLVNLPNTMDNITESIELQANALSELSNILTKTNTDLKVIGEFGALDEILGAIGFGDISNLEEQTERVVDNLRNLGRAKEVNELIKEFGEVTDLSSDELIVFNRRLSETTAELNRVAQGTKETFATLTEEVTELSKNLTSLSISFSKLSDAEKITLGLDSIISRFGIIGTEALNIASALDGLTTTDIALLGISEEIRKAQELTNELEEVKKAQEKVTKANEDFINSIGTANRPAIWFSQTQTAVDNTTKELDALQERVDKLGPDIKRAMEQGKGVFTNFIDAAKEYNDIKQRIRVEDLVDDTNLSNTINILDKNLQNEQKFLKSSVEIQRKIFERHKESAKLAENTRIELVNQLRDIAGEEESTLFKDLTNKLSIAKTAEIAANRAVRGVQNSIEEARVKGVTLLTKDITVLNKEISKLNKLSIFDSKVFEDDINTLKEVLRDRLRGLHIQLDEKEATAQFIAFSKKLKSDQQFEIELSIIGIRNAEEIVKETNRILEEASLRAKETKALSATINIDESFRSDYKNIIDERIALDKIQATTKLLLETKDFEHQEELFKSINALEEKLNAIRLKGRVDATNAATKELEILSQKVHIARQEASFGTLLNKIDRQRLATEILRAKHKGADNLDKVIDKQKELNDLANKATFSSEIEKAAESMNTLADANRDFFDSLQNSQFDNLSSGLILLQEVGRDMGGEFGDLTRGLATVGVAVQNFGAQMASLNEQKTLTADADELSLIQQKETQAILSVMGNSLGALAGAFKEGSTAAKIFTVAQQSLAIASAAAAVAQAGALPPPAGIASAAAMLALMTSVLGAFGVLAGGGGAGNANEVKANYSAQFGNDRLLRGEGSNTLTDSIDDLVAIDTQLFGVTRDLQITMKNLADTFERIGAVVLSSFSGNAGLPGYNIPTSATSGNTPGVFDNQLFDNIDKLFTLGIGGAVIDSFFGSTEVKTTIIDAGIEFAATVEASADGLEGSFAKLERKTVQLVEETTEKFFGLSSSSATSIQELYSVLPEELAVALQGALTDTFDVINGLVSTFATSVGNIDLELIFSGVSGQVFGEDFLSLFELKGEEASEAIGLYFSTLTNEILQQTLPFVQEYQIAGEELLETFIRLTIQTIALRDAFKSVGIDLARFTEFSLVEFPTITNWVNQIINDIEQGAEEVGRRLSLTVSFLPGSAPGSTQISAEAAAAAAEKFKLEVQTAWNTALLSGFKDEKEFAEIFDQFSQALFSESELLDIALTNASRVLNDGIASLYEQLTEMGRTDLISLLQGSLGDPEALREFYEAALDTGAFKVIATELGGEINTLGADLLATTVKLGAATNEFLELQKALDDLIEEINSLNESYIIQISLFGKLGKELDLLSLAFDFNDAIKEAEETGTNLALVEEAFGLERLAIVKQYFEEIEDQITGVMNSILSSTVDIAKNSNLWDDIAFNIIKINKLVTQLSKGTNSIDLSALVTDTSDFQDFIDNFQYVIQTLSEEGPGTISEEIQLVDDLRQAIMDRYSAELSLIEGQTAAFKDLAQEIRNYLDDLLISDLSPLTNFERLNEAQDQFLTNAVDVFSEDADVASNAASNLLSSADALLDVASAFFAIGPEYLNIFNLVTGVLADIDSTLIDKLTTDPTTLAVEELNKVATEQLALLDGILIELKGQNEAQLAIDVGSSITEGMTPLIGDVIDKLQSIDDGSWTTIIEILQTINETGINTIAAIETLTVGGATAEINTVTGDISGLDEFNSLASSTFPSFDIGSLDIPNDMLANIHEGEAIIPKPFAESIREGDITLGRNNEDTDERIREGSMNLIVPQDNSDVVEAIQELTRVLAISQEDLVDITSKNVEASQKIANSFGNIRPQVSTKEVA